METQQTNVRETVADNNQKIFENAKDVDMTTNCVAESGTHFGSKELYQIPPNLLATELLEPDCLAISEKIQKKLKNILKKESAKSIRYFLAQEALDYETPESFFQDLLSYGCTNDMIADAIKTEDKRKFFNDHYDEIERVRERLEEIGFMPMMFGDRRNYLTCIAVEATAYHMADEVGVKIEYWHLFEFVIAPSALDFREN